MGDAFYRDESAVLVVDRQLLLGVWREAPTVAHIERMRAANEAAHARDGEDRVTMNVVLSGTPSFSKEVRDASTSLVRDFGNRVRASARVVCLPGFAGIAARSFFSTQTLLARVGVPTKVFAEIADAADWLVPHLPASTKWTPESLRARVESVVALGTELAPA